VCKVGGALLDRPDMALDLLKVLSELQTTAKVVLVHGGGNSVERLLADLNMQSQKYKGLRISPPEHMPYVTGALAGTTNKDLCALAYSAEIPNIGLSLFDGSMISCVQTDPKLGCVGTPTANRPNMLITLLATNLLPIISSIGCDRAGNLLNVNADQAATAVAQLLDADLYLLSDVDGVWGEDQCVVDSLNAGQIASLIEKGVIKDGMQVKVSAAQLAANSLGKPVTIGSWAQIEALRAAILSKGTQSFGTQIFPTQQTN
jgi:acetylglutamate kinase